MANADCILDLGPEGGKGGGEVIFTGTPTQLLDANDSLTGAYLRCAKCEGGSVKSEKSHF